MGYQHIENLYRATIILMLRECYALEKVHGTSARIIWKDGAVRFNSGGGSHDAFTALFNEPDLVERFTKLGHPSVSVFGEFFGGKMNRQAWRYGPDMRFQAFEVKIGDAWLNVPNAHDVTNKLGLTFVDYEKISTDMESIDRARDAPSSAAIVVGLHGMPREGVVLRPLVELFTSNGSRIIAKHKRDEERETRTPRKVGEVPEVLADADQVAFEWVTPTRLEHVLGDLRKKGTEANRVEHTKMVIDAMAENVLREGDGEIVVSKAVGAAIGRATAKLFQKHLKASLA